MKPRKRSKARPKGCTWIADRGKWMVRVRLGGEDKFLGYYSSAAEASKEYNKAIALYHSEIATDLAYEVVAEKGLKQS